MSAELAGVLIPYLLTLALFVTAHRARVRHRRGMARLAAYDARVRRDLRPASTLERGSSSHAA